MVTVARRRLHPTVLLGTGGEADVYDLGDGRALKLWKRADHPDYAGDAAARAAAAARFDVQQDKLPAFPAGLPARVVAPLEPAMDRGRIVGFTMPIVAPATPLAVAAPPAARTETLRDLGETLAALHARGVVVGDLNDFNVLVGMSGAAHLIDADSFAYGRWGCPTYSERFVDPLLCDAGGPVRPHGPGSDVYAYCVMVLSSLLGVGPYDGVVPGVSAAARVSRRLTVFDAAVRYPRSARPLVALPEELLHHLHAVFARDRRGPFPPQLLNLTWRECTACGLAHARRGCPACRGVLPAPAPVTVRGRVTARWVKHLPPPLEPVPAVTLRGGRIMAEGPHGPELIGEVLGGHTQLWAGPRFGLGFYRAAGYLVGFVFDPRRRALDDSVRFPALHGADIACAHAVLSGERAWLFCLTRRGPRTTVECLALDARGKLLGHARGSDWMRRLDGACAAGPHLFYPTDEGIVRIEPDGSGGLAVTATFPDTAPFVNAGSTLYLTTEGLAAVTGWNRFVIHIAKEATS